MKKQPKLKTYVLTVSRYFPTTHPRKGERTMFPQLIIEDDKIHTVRGNYALWAKRAIEVQAGRAVVSLRYWEGKPYASKQREFLQLSYIDVQNVHVYKVCRTSSMDGYQTVHHTEPHNLIFIDDKIQPLRWPFKFAAKDGLTLSDFNGWFKKPVENAALIHFTKHFMY